MVISGGQRVCILPPLFRLTSLSTREDPEHCQNFVLRGSAVHVEVLVVLADREVSTNEAPTQLARYAILSTRAVLAVQYMRLVHLLFPFSPSLGTYLIRLEPVNAPTTARFRSGFGTMSLP